MAIDKICEELFCTGCAMCMEVCPQSAITMEMNSDGFYYPSVHETCVECRACIKRCPINSKLKKRSSTFYMGWHKDREVLRKSSSGGYFTALANYTIDHEGIVFGAIKNERKEIVHTFMKSMDDIEPLRLSKYYQSDISESYKVARRFLEEGRLVMFTGTACQIAGLQGYLNQEFDNLFTIDVLCHGVTSKKVIDSYIESKERQFKKKIVDYNFRVKETGRGWYNGGGTRMQLFFVDGSSAIEPGKYDTFFLGFNNNYFLRESCYRCKFCGTERISDITLADYWRCDHMEITDEQKKLGVSLILGNSEKGRRLLKEIAGDVFLYSIDGGSAIAHNRALSCPQERPRLRDSFFRLMAENGYDTIVHRQFKSRFRKRKVKMILRIVLPLGLYNRMFKD